MEQLLTDGLARSARLFAGKLGAVDGDARYTYRELADRCSRLGGALVDSGVGAGERVAVLMANGHRYLECYYAIPGIGAVLVPMNNRFALPEHRHVLEDAGVHTLIADETFADTAETLAPSVKQVIIGASQYESLIASGTPLPLGAGVSETDLAGLFYTGGTTGMAKGVMLSHRNLVVNALHITIALGYTEDDVYLHQGPMFHLADGASTYAITWVGGTHAFVPAFEPAAVIDILQRERVTCTLAVPTMLNALVNHPAIGTADFSAMRMVLHGAAPIATTLLERAIDVFGCSFSQGYGMTEAAPLVTVLSREEELIGNDRLRSAGRAIMGVEVDVRRLDGSSCEPGEVGEVVARGPNFMSGYWKKPEATAEVLVDGWYWTRDLGYLDEAGFLFLVDRAKDMIISGGENVYSIEVEDAILSHPDVIECAVVGVPDDRWGERVHAFIVVRPDAVVTADSLRQHCGERIADYKCPRSVDIEAELPKSGAGKILKAQLRGRYWDGQGRQIN
jgi:long-chain acyl-CoA synthetase